MQNLQQKRGKSKSSQIRDYLRKNPEAIYADVARMFGCAHNLVGRQAKKIALNSRKKISVLFDEGRVIELYNAGSNDCEIARQMGIPSINIYHWRNRTDRPKIVAAMPYPTCGERRPNGAVKPKLLAALVKHPNATSKTIAEIVGCHDSYVRAFRARQAAKGA
jgi:hypothetical protein